jgi:cytochrome c biogenesis factor
VIATLAQFYATIGTAAATLLGLLFVVVSINVSAALGPEEAVSRRLTEQAFQNYLAVMLVAFLAQFPGISTTTFGIVTLIVTAGASAWVVLRSYQTVALHIRRRLQGPALQALRRAQLSRFCDEGLAKMLSYLDLEHATGSP